MGALQPCQGLGLYPRIQDTRATRHPGTEWKLVRNGQRLCGQVDKGRWVGVCACTPRLLQAQACPLHPMSPRHPVQDQ